MPERNSKQDGVSVFTVDSIISKTDSSSPSPGATRGSGTVIHVDRIDKKPTSSGITSGGSTANNIDSIGKTHSSSPSPGVTRNGTTSTKKQEGVDHTGETNNSSTSPGVTRNGTTSTKKGKGVDHPGKTNNSSTSPGVTRNGTASTKKKEGVSTSITVDNNGKSNNSSASPSSTKKRGGNITADIISITDNSSTSPGVTSGGSGSNNASDAEFLKAACNGQLQLLKDLLVNPDEHKKVSLVKDAEGRTPLSVAAFGGHAPVVSYILNKFPDTFWEKDADVDKSYPIHQACVGGHVHVLKEFHSHCKKHPTRTNQMMFVTNKLGRNVLHLAADIGSASIVKYLIQQTDLPSEIISAKDTDGRTPYQLALRNKHLGVIEILK